MLKGHLVDSYTNYSRKLAYSHETRSVRREVSAYIKGESEGLPKYRIYSAHDDNIANWLMQLNPGLHFPGIRYSASIYFEVYKRKETGKKFVRTVYNAVPLNLEACSDDPFCEADRFETQMKNQFY